MDTPLFLRRDVHIKSKPDIQALQAVATEEYDNFYACPEPYVTIIGRPLPPGIKSLDYRDIVQPLPDSARQRPIIDLADAYLTHSGLRERGRTAVRLMLGEHDETLRSEITLFQQRVGAKIGRVIAEYHPHITIGFVEGSIDSNRIDTDRLSDSLPSTLKLGILRVQPNRLAYPNIGSAPRQDPNQPHKLPANFLAALQAGSGISN